MRLRLRKIVAEKIGLSHFVQFGLSEKEWKWGEYKDLQLAALNKKQLGALKVLFEMHEKIRGAKVMLQDLATWDRAQTEVGSIHPRTVHQFADLVTNYLRKAPKHWLYKQEWMGEIGVWEPYYVNKIEYHREVKGSGRGERDHPAYTFITLIYNQFDGLWQENLTFYEADCCFQSIAEALSAKGYYIQSPEMAETYAGEMERWMEIHQKIGKQYLAVGFGYKDVDGNQKERESSWFYRESGHIHFDKLGDPSKVLVDLFYEEEEQDRGRRERAYVDEYFWKTKERHIQFDEELEEDEADEDAGTEPADSDDEPGIPQRAKIPIHPELVVFDLVKHLRLRVHVSQLTEYTYDPTLSGKLVLSEERKKLIKLLIDSRDNQFKDLVKGKSGGSVVLLAGPPGTGKTLTAEVYAESEGCGLYSVQCSQLGTDPESLEEQLLKVFARAARWRAVLLLDEADVYVHQRGNNLQQNAIVGVFLRVLEYQAAVMFLTTNRPEDVDDAIASRCIAKLTYELPQAGELEQLWQVLAASCGATFAPPEADTIEELVTTFPQASGRDVKNLLKLARLINPIITVENVEFVSRFKPTGTEEEREENDRWLGHPTLEPTSQ